MNIQTKYAAIVKIFRYHTKMSRQSFSRAPRVKLIPFVVGLISFVLTFSSSKIVAKSTSKVIFLRDIRPILQKSCTSCHGIQKQMAGLRLDSRAFALAGGESGAVIQPGDSDASVLFQRVAGIGDQPQMPMGEEPLELSQIELLRNWIDQGAYWPKELSAEAVVSQRHWAYVAPKQSQLPVVSRPEWVVNPIDTFVLARLEAEGLSPSVPADRVTILRRLSLDLIGLPPTIEEVDAFLAGNNDQAYEEEVERLLRSPHYGERWGRHWLDGARYADSDGFEKDLARVVWFYRDWVIKALNRDLPYDQFIIEQLAGDMLPGATQDQVVATGFLRNSMMNLEGGIDPEQFRMEAMFDRMDALGKSILGITIQCAQCHNHKYDPLTQKEYYRLFAFLNNSHEAKIAVYTPEEQARRAELLEQIQRIKNDLKQRYPDWRKSMKEWEEHMKHDQPEWIVVRPKVEEFSTEGQKYLPLKDGSLLAQGSAPSGLRVKMTAKTNVRNIVAFRLELLTDSNLPFGGPGRSVLGTAALTEFEVEAAPADDPSQLTQVTIASATADISPTETALELRASDPDSKARVMGPVKFAIDGMKETAWGINTGSVRRNQARKAVFVAEQPVDNPRGTLLTFYLNQKHGGGDDKRFNNRNLGRLRLSITKRSSVQADPLPKQVREIFSIPRNLRTPTQVDTVFSYWLSTVPEWSKAQAQIKELWFQHPEGTTQLVLEERTERRETNILARGDFLRPGETVGPGVPSFLHSWSPGAPPNRLTLAKWLVSRESPTTARAIVNRVWQAYFGVGLVRSSEDLGRQSEAPSHPELLDWLAVEFMDQDWSLKALHRLIVGSATYRQSSWASPQLYRQDPYNRWLGRGPRFRVNAEIVRDIALAASGLLSPRIGGPSVYSPAPLFLFVPPTSFSKKIWEEVQGEDRYRRGIYTFRYRSVPYPMLQAFDAPSGESSCVRRPRSNTPLQALTTLNEPVFLEAARALALRSLRDGGESREQRLTYAFRRCLSRKPTKVEIDRLLRFLSQQERRLAEGWISPWDIAGYHSAALPQLPEQTTPVHLAAWTAVSRILLNLDETITKE